MIQLKRLQPGDKLNDAQLINQLIDAIEELRAMPPGPGLGKTCDGVLFVINQSTAPAAKGRGGGITDIQYSTTTHKLTYTDANGATVEITEAVPES